MARQWKNTLTVVSETDVADRVAVIRAQKVAEESRVYGERPEFPTDDEPTERDTNPARSAREAVRLILAEEADILARRRSRMG